MSRHVPRGVFLEACALCGLTLGAVILESVQTSSLFVFTSCVCYQGNMRHWIEDSDCRDQYSVIYESGERTAIFANDAKEPIVVEERAVSKQSRPIAAESGLFQLLLILTSQASDTGC